MSTKLKNILILLIIIALIGTIYLTCLILDKTHSEKGTTKRIILTSFYPVYVMTLNLMDGTDAFEVENMTDNISTCIHDYTLSTKDLKKLEKAEVFIQNGMGLESFSETVSENYPDVKNISIANNINGLISDEDEINSHIWLSIANYKKSVNNLADELMLIDEIEKEQIEENRYSYLQELDELEGKFNELSDYEGKKAICLNESLEYLLYDLKMEVTSFETNHEESAFSAEQIREIADKSKEDKTDYIFIEENDDDKMAKTIAAESGATIIRLKDGMRRSKFQDIESYIKIMTDNYETLKWGKTNGWKRRVWLTLNQNQKHKCI